MSQISFLPNEVFDINRTTLESIHGAFTVSPPFSQSSGSAM